MATDPRLNLTAFAQVNVGPVSASIGAGADSCSSNVSENLTNTLSANISASGILPGNIGAFANLQVGLGGGTVGAGLANLAAISNNIRISGPSTAANPQGLPVSSDPSVGPNFVLQQVGLSSTAITAVGQVNASVGANANIQAGLVFNQVQGGTFTTANIPTAFSAFQNATQVLSTIFSPPAASSPQGSQFGSFCGAKPYAIDLIKFAPKYKFLFVVQFEFNPQFSEVLKAIDPAFVVKTSTRPTVEFEYQDVNMYNFRTKVPTRTLYQPMTMRFYDDDLNNAFQLYNTYLKLMSPIANIDIESQSIDPLDAYDNAGGGMGFSQTPQKIQAAWTNTVGQGYAASLGPYGRIPTGSSSGTSTPASNIRNVLRRITLFQVYRSGMLMNVYHFYNPKITTMALDDMDMATTADGNEVSFTFTYDSVFIIPGYNINANAGGVNYSLPNYTDDGIYPFGIQPGSLPNSVTGNLKDGIGAGIVDGQSNMIANAAAGPSSSQFMTIPTSVASFLPSNPTTLSGTSFANMAPAPAIVGGGSDISTTLQGNTSDDLSQVTTTITTLQDPVTGTQQDSANNSGNLGNVQAQSANALNQAQSQYNTAQQNLAAARLAQQQNPSEANNLAQMIANRNVQNAFADLQSAQNANNQTNQPSTTYVPNGS